MSDDPISESLEPRSHRIPGCTCGETEGYAMSFAAGCPVHDSESVEPRSEPPEGEDDMANERFLEALAGMETCPTCWQPVPVPQRGDHDYGIALRPAIEEQAEAARLPLEWLALREAATDVRDNPVNAYDLPRSWQAQAALVDALAALDARLTAKGEPRE